MLEMFDAFKKLFGLLQASTVSDITSRKRRLSDRPSDPDLLYCKMPRLDDFSMPRCSSPLQDLDMPSTSKHTFKKPSFPSARSFLRPTEFIDLSSDEENDKFTKSDHHDAGDGWVTALKMKDEYWSKMRPFRSEQKCATSVLRKAKHTLNNCNNFIASNYQPKKSVLNESIRLGERDRYRQILNTMAPKIYTLKDLNGTERKLKTHIKTDNLTEKIEKISIKPKAEYNGFEKFRSPKHLDLNGAKTIDLCSDDQSKPKSISLLDSDSDSEVKIVSPKKISPVNSLKKRLEIEPLASQNWINEWNEQYSRRTAQEKQLIEDQKIRRDKLRELNRANFQSRAEKLQSCLRITDVVLLDEPPEESLNLPELTDEQEKMINSAFRPGPGNQVFIDKFNLRITRADLKTLQGLNWLNDEVINFYTNLIMERGNGTNTKLPKVHSMNTFFYPKLVSQGYSSLRRWTKKVDIFDKDMIIIPVHLGVHWCMAIIDFREKVIKYFDSMGSDNPTCLKALSEYLNQEHLDKKKTAFDSSSWKAVCVKDIPLQMNGSDCGMFSCMYAEFLTRNAKILFTQEHMPYFRRKMVLEIITGKLLMK